MRAFLIILTVTVWSLNAIAQDIQFSFNNGNESVYGLEDVKQMIFEGDLLNLEMLDGMVYTWNIATLANFTFDTQTGISDALADANKIKMRVFPNPTAGELEINYELQDPTKVRLTISSIDGKDVFRVFTGIRQMGAQNHKVQLTDMASGIYICRLTTDHFSVSKKIVLNQDLH